MSTSSLNPNVVKTALDVVFMPEFERQELPQFATAETASVFVQDRATSSAVIGEVFEGSGEWTKRAEEENVESGSFRAKNPQTFFVSEFNRSLDIPRTFADDDQHSVVTRAVTGLARRGRTTRNKNAFGIFRDAFAGSQYLTNDGKAIVADDHPVKGGVVDNKLAGGGSVLSDTSLSDATVMLSEMKSQDNVIEGCVPTVLLVPPKLFKLASEITRSEQKAGTPNNDMNIWYSSLYSIEVRQSNFLGLAAGGSDTAWFLLADNHMVTRFVREDIWTEVVDWKYQRNNNWIYKGGFRETLGCPDYIGIIGAVGA